MGGRGSTSSTNKSNTSLAVKENPYLKREIGNARYAIQFDSNGGIRVVDFNSEARTDNEQKNLHSIDSYGNMKIYQRTGSSDIYLLTDKQMQQANKMMPTRTQLQQDREGTIRKMETIVKKYSTKTIKRKKIKNTKQPKNDLPF